ncbi:hypothetical protein [Sphingomonas sp.]|uniref:hypothetical protein n=1 Tax=Sphingomonas sp. TaxID=28214 RepID=UPI003D6CC99C
MAATRTTRPRARKTTVPAPRKAAANKSSPKLKTSTMFSIGAGVLTVGVALAGWLARRQIAAWAAPGSAEHDAPDLALDQPRPSAGDRAPVDFRPDIDAPMSPAEREALRPAAVPARS